MCLFKAIKARRFEWSDITLFKFRYSTGNMMYADVQYKLRSEDGEYKAYRKQNLVPDDKADIFTVDSAFVLKLTELLKRCSLEKWDGFNKSDKRVLDGYSFGIYIRNAKGQLIRASGYMKWPKNYKEVKQALTELFDSL